MLLSTFQHLKGVGKKTESYLWEKGVLDWDTYLKSNGTQRSLFGDDSINPIESSIQACERGDTDYFADKLAKREYYRIALTYPEDTLFLDIETTGLSLYYDQITLVGWSIGHSYGVYVRDHDPSGLLNALRTAKAIMTFNGTIFDIRFLEKAFPGIYIPSIHVDLRFFAKRAGLSGGQKAIEPQVGYQRPKLVKGMEGESAPILWYKYRRGDKRALKELVTYNHADIEGMKWIFDYALEKIFEIDDIPPQIRSRTKFSNLKSKIQWAKQEPKNGNPYKVYLTKFSGQLRPLITYRELNRIVPLSKTTFIGIDLVSSEDRESGYCILTGNRAETFRIKTDDEMIRLAQEAEAALVSIDSPLSIPKGRNTYFDDDPDREKYGIMRECERLLKKRGVNVYPCLIPSMQKLTRRGIHLADKFRKLGIPVIESYPGAAQDILAIPRKRAGLKYLADALAEFGIYDNFTKRKISHDELDAITSAIVGIFFWTGKFEGIGNFDEEYLIIPDLNAASKGWISRKVIGISGDIGSGKSTVADYLKSRGFVTLRFSRLLEKLLRDKGVDVNRSSLQELGAEIHQSNRQRWLGKKLIEFHPGSRNMVIEGLRYPEDYALMVESFGPSFLHLHIEAPFTIRQNRIKERGIKDIPIQQSMSSPTEAMINELRKLANHTICNEQELSQLNVQIDRILN
ncbi:MAG: DUF429 domain-containing protein [Deltaproteobacteria bacterium]|nr:DUF429 domain-containing protein [Deltaproteobacteria bacterium]